MYDQVAGYYGNLLKAAISCSARPTIAEITRLRQSCPNEATDKRKKNLKDLFSKKVDGWSTLDEDTRSLHIFAVLSLLTGGRLMPDIPKGTRGYSFHGAIINHACIPNAIMSSAMVERPIRGDEWVDGLMTVKALKPIQRGEEVTIAYDLRIDLSPTLRRQQLEEDFGFRCRCITCLHGSPDLDEQLAFANNAYKQFFTRSLSTPKRYRWAYQYLRVVAYARYNDFPLFMMYDTLGALAIESGDELRAKQFVMIAAEWGRQHLSVGHRHTERQKSVWFDMDGRKIPSMYLKESDSDKEAMLFMTDHKHEDDTYYWLGMDNDELKEFNKEQSEQISKLRSENNGRSQGDAVSEWLRIQQATQAKAAAEKASEDAHKALMADLDAEGAAESKKQESAAKRAAKRQETRARLTARKEAKNIKHQNAAAPPTTEAPSTPEPSASGPSAKTISKAKKEPSRKQAKKHRQMLKQKHEQDAKVSQPHHNNETASDPGFGTTDDQASQHSQPVDEGIALPFTPPSSSPLSSKERDTPSTEGYSTSPVSQHQATEDYNSLSSGLSDRSETVGWPTPPSSPVISDGAHIPIFEFTGFRHKLERRPLNARFDECDPERQSWVNTNAYSCQATLLPMIYDTTECNELNDVFADCDSWSRIDSIVESVSPHRPSGRVWERFRAAKRSDPCDGEPTLLSLPFERSNFVDFHELDIDDQASEIETDPCGGDCSLVASTDSLEDDHRSEGLDAELAYPVNVIQSEGNETVSIGNTATAQATVVDITAESPPRSPLPTADGMPGMSPLQVFFPTPQPTASPRAENRTARGTPKSTPTKLSFPTSDYTPSLTTRSETGSATGITHDSSGPAPPGTRVSASTRLYVSNLLCTTSHSDVKRFFRSHGFGLNRIKLFIDPFTGRNPGYAWVDLEIAGEAGRAIETLNGMKLRRRKVNIQPAMKREGRPREARVRNYMGNRDGSRGVFRTSWRSRSFNKLAAFKLRCRRLDCSHDARARRS